MVTPQEITAEPWCAAPTPCAPRTTTGEKRAPSVRDVLDDAARTRLVGTIVGRLRGGVTEPVLQRAFEYWRNVDKDLGDRVEHGVRA